MDEERLYPRSVLRPEELRHYVQWKNLWSDCLLDFLQDFYAFYLIEEVEKEKYGDGKMK